MSPSRAPSIFWSSFLLSVKWVAPDSKWKCPRCAPPLRDYKSQGARGDRSSPSPYGTRLPPVRVPSSNLFPTTAPPRPPLPAAGAGAGARGKTPWCQDLPRTREFHPTWGLAIPEPDIASLGGFGGTSDLRSQGKLWNTHAWVSGKRTGVPALLGRWMGAWTTEIIVVLGAFDPGEQLELEFLDTLIGDSWRCLGGILGVSDR